MSEGKTLTELMRARYPGLPYFLFGHSMGSLLARLYLPVYGDLVDGCILCGTVGPNPFAKTGIRLADFYPGLRWAALTANSPIRIPCSPGFRATARW